MKKIGSIALSLLACSLVAFGDMDDKTSDLKVVGDATATNAFVMRGTLEAVAIDCAANCTGTVVVATDDGRTLFSLASIIADAVYPVVMPTYLATGASAWTVTNNPAYPLYMKPAVAGKVTVTLLGQNAATITNNTKVTLIYQR